MTQPATALVLRTCGPDGESHSGFRWPLTVGAEVVAPDWEPTQKCGNGLHGALHGQGDGGLFDWSADAVWMVVEVESAWIVDLIGKVKFPACVVRYVGDRKGATDYIMTHDPLARCVIGATVTGGDRATVTGGDRATVTGGDYATVTGGYRATVTGGNDATVTGGGYAILQLKWYDGDRYRITTDYVGENGVLPYVAYRCDTKGKLVRA
jgi:hypothetical protein